MWKKGIERGIKINRYTSWTHFRHHGFSRLRSNRWPIKRARFQGSKKQVEYRERTVDGRFSLPSCAPIIPDVAQNEAISRPRAIARFWLNCSTGKKTPPRGRRGEVACSMESGETLGSRSETGMQRGGRLRSIPRKDGHWSIPRLSDGPANNTRIYPPFLPPSPLHTRYIRCAQREKLYQSLDISKIFPSLFSPSFSFSFHSLPRQIRPKSKKTATAHT